MSEKITIYEKPTCTTCRKLNKLFEENGVDYQQVDYFIEPLNEEKLSELLKKANISAFDAVRKNEAEYKDLEVKNVRDEKELIKLMVENPNLLQRPIVEVDDKAILARPVERVSEILSF